jgi:hypothetical protein
MLSCSLPVVVSVGVGVGDAETSGVTVGVVGLSLDEFEPS